MLSLAPLKPSPMLTRPDTPAVLAFEDAPRPMLTDDEQLVVAATLIGEMYPTVELGGCLFNSTLQN